MLLSCLLYDVFCASRNAAQSSSLTSISIFFSWQAFQRKYPKCDLSFNLSGITTVTNWRQCSSALHFLPEPVTRVFLDGLIMIVAGEMIHSTGQTNLLPVVGSEHAIVPARESDSRPLRIVPLEKLKYCRLNLSLTLFQLPSNEQSGRHSVLLPTTGTKHCRITGSFDDFNNVILQCK